MKRLIVFSLFSTLLLAQITQIPGGGGGGGSGDATKAGIQNNSYLLCTSASGNDNYACSVTPALTAYANGTCVLLSVDIANTGSASLNVNGLGAETIFSSNGATLVTNQFIPTQKYNVCYNDDGIDQWWNIQFVVGGLGGYSAAVSAQTTLTVTAATHLQGTIPIATCYEGTTPFIATSCYYTKATNGDLVFTWSPAFTGLVVVQGQGTAVSETSTIASGTKALDTDAILTTACDTLATTSATGVASTDIVIFTPNADITGVTGYTPATAGKLFIEAWPTANTINWKVCNPTAGTITPGAVTLNYRVVR